MTEGQRSVGKNVALKNALRAVSTAAVGAFGLAGITINREGFHSALFKVSTGAKGGTTVAVDAKLQESADGTTWNDCATSPQNAAVAIAQITDQNQDQWLSVDLSGYKKNVRLAFQVALASSTIILDSECVLGGSVVKPTTQS